MQTVTVKLPDELVQKLEMFARENERNKSYYIRKAIIQLIEDLEDIKIAEERLADGEEPIPFSQIIRENGLDN